MSTNISPCTSFHQQKRINTRELPIGNPFVAAPAVGCFVVVRSCFRIDRSIEEEKR